MKWQRQDINECWITSLAMVLGKSVRELRHEFETLAGNIAPYYDLPIRYPMLWWSIAGAMSSRYNFIGDPGSTTSNFAFPVPIGAQSTRLTSNRLKGRGILSVILSKKWAHAVAFHDGMIYDPTPMESQSIDSQVMSLHDWRKRYPRIKTWRIDRAPVDNPEKDETAIGIIET